MDVKLNKCANPKYFTERENKVGLFFMVIVHLFLGQFISKLDSFKIGLQGSYRGLKINSQMDEFETSKWFYILANFGVWIVFGGIALGINMIYGAAGYGGNFGALEAECKDFRHGLFM